MKNKSLFFSLLFVVTVCSYALNLALGDGCHPSAGNGVIPGRVVTTTSEVRAFNQACWAQSGARGACESGIPGLRSDQSCCYCYRVRTPRVSVVPLICRYTNAGGTTRTEQGTAVITVEESRAFIQSCQTSTRRGACQSGSSDAGIPSDWSCCYCESRSGSSREKSSGPSSGSLGDSGHGSDAR